MSETKTSKEIHAALIAAGVKAQDLVRLSNNEMGYVVSMSDLTGAIHIAIAECSFFSYYDDSNTRTTAWPTHFARPCFLNSSFSYENIAPFEESGTHTFTMVGNNYFCNTIEIDYPEPLTLEQRIERLEKKLGEFP